MSPFKEAPYSFQYMSVFQTKSYLNLKKLIFCTTHCILAFGNAEIQYLENYTVWRFSNNFQKDSKLYNNVFSAIKKVGHRGYLSAKTAFLVDIGHIDGDVMLSW